MKEKKDAINDIELIKQMLAESQNLLPFRSEHLILWGLIIPIATIGTFAFDLLGIEKFIGLIWAILCSIGGYLSFTIGKKITPKHKTKISSVYSMLWIGLLISILIIVVSIFAGLIPLNIALAFMAILLGLCFFATGYLYRNNTIKVISILWYLLAIVLLLVRNYNSGYIMGISSLFLNLIPGVVLRRKK